MVLQSGFQHTPVTKSLILFYATTTLLSSLLSIHHLLPIYPHPHLYPYLQLSRFLTYQLATTHSTSLLFTLVLLYHLRILERLWGSRKYASFLLISASANLILTPSLTVLLYGVSGGWYNYLPAGLTGVAFAGLSAWRDEVPGLYRYKLLTGGGEEDAGRRGVVLSDKSTTYLIAGQLTLCQWPWNLVPAAVGWCVGMAWIGDVLPGGAGRWRIPGWVVGEGGARGRAERERYEGLLRRLEEEDGGVGVGDGMRRRSVVGEEGSTRNSGRGDGRRSGIVGQLGEYFRGVF